MERNCSRERDRNKRQRSRPHQSDPHSSTGNELPHRKTRPRLVEFSFGKRGLERTYVYIYGGVYVCVRVYVCVDDSFDRRRIQCVDLFSINRTARVHFPPTGEPPVMELSSKRAQNERPTDSPESETHPGKNVLEIARGRQYRRAPLSI